MERSLSLFVEGQKKIPYFKCGSCEADTFYQTLHETAAWHYGCCCKQQPVVMQLAGMANEPVVADNVGTKNSTSVIELC